MLCLVRGRVVPLPSLRPGVLFWLGSPFGPWHSRAGGGDFNRTASARGSSGGTRYADGLLGHLGRLVLRTGGRGPPDGLTGGSQGERGLLGAAGSTPAAQLDGGVLPNLCAPGLIVHVAGQVCGGLLLKPGLLQDGGGPVGDGPGLGGQRHGLRLVGVGIPLIRGGDGHIAYLHPDVAPPEVCLKLAQVAGAEVHEVSDLAGGCGLLAAVLALLGLGEQAGRLGSAHSPRRSGSVDSRRQVVREGAVVGRVGRGDRVGHDGGVVLPMAL